MDPIAVGLTRPYYLKSEREKDGITAKIGATKWIIGAFDSFTKAMIRASFISDNISMEIQGEKKIVKKDPNVFSNADFIIVGHGLKGFENFGNVKFETARMKLFDRELDICSMDILKQIPLEAIEELSNAIWNDNQVDEELAKN